MSKVDRRDKWLKRLANEDKAHAGWRKRAKAADEAYCSYDSDKTGPLFPVFTTTVKTIHGRIYGQPPKPDVPKRHPSGPQNQAPSAPVPQGLPPPAGPQNGAGMAGPSPMAQGQPGLPQPSSMGGGDGAGQLVGAQPVD